MPCQGLFDKNLRFCMMMAMLELLQLKNYGLISVKKKSNGIVSTMMIKKLQLFVTAAQNTQNGKVSIKLLQKQKIADIPCC